MRIYSHKGCQTCIVQATCTSVCESYKKTLKRKYDINVEGDPPLDVAEKSVAQLLVDCGHEDVNLAPGSTIKHTPADGQSFTYIEADVQIKT
jgi:hypothetical protein